MAGGEIETPAEWKQSGDEWLLPLGDGVTGRVVRLAEHRWGGGLVVEAPGVYALSDDAKAAVSGIAAWLTERLGIAAEF